MKLPGIFFKWWFYFVLILSGFLMYSYSFLQLRKSDKQFEIFFAEHGLESFSSINYHDAGLRKIRYVQIGEEDRPLVVFIHGSPSSSSFWSEFLIDSALVHNSTLIAIDRPGYGYSGFGKIITSVKKQAELIAGLIDELDDDFTSVTILGSSYGGTVAARIAMDYPELVDGLILQSSSIAPGQEKTYWITYPTSHWMFSWLMPPTLDNANQEKLSHKSQLEEMLPFWGKIKSRVTILHGENDGLIFPANAEFAIEKLVNAEKVDLHMLPGKAHDLAWTAPELIKRVILENVKIATAQRESYSFSSDD